MMLKGMEYSLAQPTMANLRFDLVSTVLVPFAAFGSGRIEAALTFAAEVVKPYFTSPGPQQCAVPRNC
jgi:hypothetical protein